jgi:hypothetical protein
MLELYLRSAHGLASRATSPLRAQWARGPRESRCFRLVQRFRQLGFDVELRRATHRSRSRP